MDDPPEGGAAFRLIMLNNRTAERKFATEMRYIGQGRMTRDSLRRYIVISDLRLKRSNDLSINGAKPYLLEPAGLGAGNCAGDFAVAGFAGVNGFAKASPKS